jgi:lambda family phage tail tape measure protein
VLDYDLAQGELKGTAAAAAAELRKMADGADADKFKLAQLAEVERIQKRVEKIRAAADAQALSNREARVAQELAAIDEKILVKGSALYKEWTEVVRDSVNAAEDQLLVQRLRTSGQAVDADVARLQEETALIGKNTVERNIATYALRLQADARKELANSPGMAKLIEDDSADKLKRYAEAARQAYDTQRDAATGMRNAVAKYMDDSSNMAAVTERLFERTTNGIEDSLTELMTTGQTSIKTLVNSMLAEFNRLAVVRPLMASLLGGSGGAGGGGINVLGLLAQGAGSLFSGNLGTSGTAALANLGGGDALDNFLAMNGNFAGARAAGGPVEAGARYLVGERGAEAFVPRVPGTILPSSALQAAGGPAVTINQTFNVGQGASRADMVAAAKAGRDQAIAEIVRMSRNGSI